MLAVPSPCTYFEAQISHCPIFLADKCLVNYYGGCDASRMCENSRNGSSCGYCFPRPGKNLLIIPDIAPCAGKVCIFWRFCSFLDINLALCYLSCRYKVDIALVLPPHNANKGHFGAGHVVLCREVVLFSEVVIGPMWKALSFIKGVPFSEGPLLEVPL